MSEAPNQAAYEPRDTLYLWWLGQPDAPVLIGDLHLVRTLRGVSLRYSPTWLAAGFPLSEDLPLLDHEFIPTEKDVAAGAVDDARPDRWGERVIRYLDRPARLSLMEYLYFAGDERFGALGVSLARDRYLPRRVGSLPKLGDVTAIEGVVRSIIAGEAVAPALARLVAPGVTMGGARPKALLDMDGAQWVLKFGEEGDTTDSPLIEHATMRLAAECAIRVAATRPIELDRGHAVAIRRFDREAGRRRHALSACVALKAAGEEMGYPELAQLLRRRGPVAGGVSRLQRRELFRRMLFNILIDNTDDHEKNHALLMNDSGEYELSPAFDVLPAGQALGYQQMRVGSDGADSTLANALSECGQFGLTKKEAEKDVRLVAGVVEHWRQRFREAGVSAADIDALAGQIDRPALLDQRRAWA